MDAPKAYGGAGSPNAGISDIFENEESVIKALAIIRSSPLSVESKHKLRDLFMDYAGEPDESKRNELRAEISSEISANKDKLAGLSLPAESPKESSLAGLPRRSRPKPTFNPVFNSAVIETPTEEAAVEITPPAAPVPEPVTVVAPMETSVTSTIETTPITAPAAPIAPPAAAIDLKSRVDQIKREVNSRIGNPVNLIAADENIGREYMSALLAAMKSVSGGGGEQAAAERLEAAFAAARPIIENIVSNKTGSPVEKSTTSSSLTEKVETETEPVKPPEPVKANIQPEVPLNKPPMVGVNSPEPLPVDTLSEIKQVTEEESKEPVSGLYHRPIDEVETPENETSNRRGLNWLLKKDEKDSAIPKENQKTNAPQSVPTPLSNLRHLNVQNDNEVKAEQNAPIHSLKDSVALPEKMEKIREEADKRAEAKKKPITDLNDPDIQAGLEKLLAEWSLFKSSGFLGTGPKGIQHPVYKKLAPLPMAAVVAGRFEGSTPEIKQQITDYMNGWRYEQGILHEMGETFEHYLRRVIKQIIERQRFSARISLS